MERVAIVRYNAGNTRSVRFALERLGVEAEVTDDPATLKKADKVIFPGVGHAKSAMAWLKERGLDEVLLSLEQPTLGICLGMQLMCSRSEEGDTECLGIFPEAVHHFPEAQQGEKIPHMGWNQLTDLKGPLFEGVEEESYVYFVHSYYVETGAATVAKTHHILPFSAALAKGNYFAVQFHPERSGPVGHRILENFLRL